MAEIGVGVGRPVGFPEKRPFCRLRRSETVRTIALLSYGAQFP